MIIGPRSPIGEVHVAITGRIQNQAAPRKRRQSASSDQFHRHGCAHSVILPETALLTLVLISFLLSAGPAAADSEILRLKLRLGVASTPVPLAPNSVLWLAKDLGFYQREGLDVDVVEAPGTPPLLIQMQHGDLDVGNLATADVIRLTASRRLEMRAIHSPDADLHFIVVAGSDLRSVEELRGKTFAVARLGSLDDSLARLVLASRGLKPGEVSFVAIGTPTARVQALVGGRIDATLVGVGTWITIRQNARVRVLVDRAEVRAVAPPVQKVDAVTRSVLERKPEQLKRFTIAIVKASRYLAKGEQIWVDAMARRRPDVNRRDLGELWQLYKTSWAVNGQMNLTEYQQTADFLYRTPDFEWIPRIRVSDWTDSRFLKAALEEIGIYRKFDDPEMTPR